MVAKSQLTFRKTLLRYLQSRVRSAKPGAATDAKLHNILVEAEKLKSKIGKRRVKNASVL